MADLKIIGRVLDGRYRVDSELGAGGMATAYLAYEESLDRQVVVKVPDPALLQDEGFRRRFQQEIRSLTRLRHPRVVSILAAGEIEGVPYAVMDYLQGGSLRDRMSSGEGAGGEQRVHAVLDWLPAMAEALDFMHGEGVVHRDVKPGNILFDGHGNAFLSDFGIAKALGTADTGITRTGTTVGTAIYMAPEQGLTTDLGGAADQYALGVIVYEILAGRPPIEGGTAAILLVRKVTEPPEPISGLVPGLPPEAADAVMRALEREKTGRFPSCREFARAFSAAFAGDDPAIETAVPIAEAVPAADATGTLEQPRAQAPAPAPPVPTPRPAAAPTVGAPEAKAHTRRRAIWWAAAILGVLALVVGLRIAKQSDTGEAAMTPPAAEPTVLSDLMPSGTLVTGADWTCAGTLTGPGSVELNGVRAAPDASGRFTAKAKLEEGPNLILLRSLDAAGREVGRREYRVTLDSRAPTMRIDAPAPAFVTREPSVEVRGVVSDLEPDHVLVDGRKVRIGPDGAFRIELDLEEGPNRVSIVAVDKAGNRSPGKTVAGSRDGTPPSVRLGRLPPSTASESIPVKGTVSEDGCRVTVNGRPAEVKGTGFFIEVPLDPGPNLIEVQATDPLGNAAPPTVLRITRTRGKIDLRVAPRPDPGVRPPEATSLLAGSWVLDPDATCEAFAEWQMSQMTEGMDPQESREARAQIRRQAARELATLEVALDLGRDGSLDAVVGTPGAKTGFAGRWETLGKEVRLTLTHEDGEKQPEPEVMTGTPEGATLVLRGDSLPFPLVLRRRGESERPAVPAPPRPVPDSRNLAGIYRLDADRTLAVSERMILAQIEEEYGHLSGADREQALALARQQMKQWIANMQFQLQLSSDGGFMARGAHTGEKLDARGTWTATPSTITITTTWEDGRASNPPEVQTGRIVDGRLHFRLDEDVPLELVLVRL